MEIIEFCVFNVDRKWPDAEDLPGFWQSVILVLFPMLSLIHFNISMCVAEQTFVVGVH